MGFSGISFGSLLIVFIVIVVLFGTKRLGRIAQDLGDAVHKFRKGLQDDSPDSQSKKTTSDKNDSNH